MADTTMMMIDFFLVSLVFFYTPPILLLHIILLFSTHHPTIMYYTIITLSHPHSEKNEYSLPLFTSSRIGIVINVNHHLLIGAYCMYFMVVPLVQFYEGDLFHSHLVFHYHQSFNEPTTMPL